MKHLTFLIATFLLVSCSPQATPLATDATTSEQSSPSNVEMITLVSPSGTETKMVVEVADDTSEQEIGLMNRTSLAEDSGMLFVFPDSAVRHFWMKNTLIPLDILYFDAEKRFVSRVTMPPCEAEPCTTYSSYLQAMYALEVAAGEDVTADVGEGWQFR